MVSSVCTSAGSNPFGEQVFSVLNHKLHQIGMRLSERLVGREQNSEGGRVEAVSMLKRRMPGVDRMRFGERKAGGVALIAP